MKNEMNTQELNDIKEILEEVGTYIEEITPETKLDELILDSMSLISFYVEVEEKFNIFLPEDIYSKRLDEFTVSKFWSDVILANA